MPASPGGAGHQEAQRCPKPSDALWLHDRQSIPWDSEREEFPVSPRAGGKQETPAARRPPRSGLTAQVQPAAVTCQGMLSLRAFEQAEQPSEAASQRVQHCLALFRGCLRGLPDDAAWGIGAQSGSQQVTAVINRPVGMLPAV